MRISPAYRSPGQPVRTSNAFTGCSGLITGAGSQPEFFPARTSQSFSLVGFGLITGARSQLSLLTLPWRGPRPGVARLARCVLHACVSPTSSGLWVFRPCICISVRQSSQLRPPHQLLSIVGFGLITGARSQLSLLTSPWRGPRPGFAMVVGRVLHACVIPNLSGFMGFARASAPQFFSLVSFGLHRSPSA